MKTTIKFYFYECQLILLICFLLNNCLSPLLAEEIPKPETLILQGNISRTIPSGTPIELKIISLPMSQGSYLENWDLEEKFNIPAVGSPLEAELNKDIYIEKDLILPKGTRFLGKISQIIAPKHFGRNGHIEVSFDGLKTPKGKYLQFGEAAHNNPAPINKRQEFFRGATRLGAYSLGGAAAGTLVATQTAGMILTALRPEYILTGGAAIGLLVGVVASIVKKGKPGYLMPGDEIQINLQQSLLLPVAERPEEQVNPNFGINGLNLELEKAQLIKDDLGKDILILNLNISNQTNLNLFTSDLVLLGPYNRLIYQGGFSTLSMTEPYQRIGLNKIMAGQSLKGQIAFEIDFPGFEHFLIFKDRQSQSTIYKNSLGNLDKYKFIDKKTKWKEKFFGQNSQAWQ